MTKAQIWIAAFVVLFILLYAIQKFTTPAGGADSGQAATQTQSTSGQNFDAKTSLVKFNCVSCHGPDLRGSGSGPSLAGLSSYYTADKLVAFLKDPTAFAAEPRHKDRAGKYPQFMPSFGNRNEQELAAIAQYLLTLH